MNAKQAMQLLYPTQVMVQTTSRCNSGCVICPYPKLNKTMPHTQMSDNLFRNLMDEIAGYPKLDRAMLYLMNEPLCDKNILDRISYARNALPDTEIYILTNGVNLTDDLAAGLIESGLSWIGFSVHAIVPDTYEKITGRNDFAKIRDRIDSFIEQALAKRGPDFVQVNVTRVRPFVSESEFADAGTHWRSLGLTRVDLDHGYISRAGNVEVFGHEPVCHSAVTGCDTLWAYKMVHVLADGLVIPCCMDWGKSEILGNVNNTSLLDVWRGVGRKSFLNKLCGENDQHGNFICLSCEDAIPAPLPDDEKDSSDHIENQLPKTIDLLLVNPPPWLPYGPPLGLASLAAYLGERGFVADVLDANIELFDKCPESLRKLWDWEQGLLWEKQAEVTRLFCEDLEGFAIQIAEHPAKVVGFSVASRKEYPITLIVKRLMELAPDKTLLFGGPGVVDRPDRDRLHGMIGDAVAATGKDILYGFIVGEGEGPLVDCLEHLREDKSIEGLEGLAIYRHGGQVQVLPRKPIADLSDLPIPDFSVFPLDKYTHPSLTIEWSRGCIGNCAFCNIRDLWGRYRSKSAEAVLDELEHLVRTYKKNWFSICDPVINGRPDVLEEICDGIVSRGLQIKWAAGISPNREVTARQFSKMKAAGCYRLEFGIESASDAVLNKMGKRYDAKQAGGMIRDCHEAGIEVVLYLIVGFPGETEEDFSATLSFLTDIAPYVHLVRSVNGLILVQGSPMEKEIGAFGLDPLDRDHAGWVTRWSAGDNTAPMRVERIDRVLAHLKQLNVPVEFSNREEVMGDQERFAGRVDQIEEKLADFETRMQRFIELQEKVLRGEPVRENPFADQVALVLCPVWGTAMPPLGLSYVASFLKNQGWRPELIDFNIELFHSAPENLRVLFGEENFRHWTDPESFVKIKAGLSNDIDALVDRLIQTGRKVIGFSVYSPNRLFTIEVCHRLKTKAPDRIVVVGGRGVLTENERLLFPPGAVDYFVVGEGEVTLVPLLEAIFSDRDGAKLPGVVRFQGVHLTPLAPRPLYDDLSIFPHPDWDGLDLDAYTEEELPLLFSRGCVGHCTFCNDHKAMGRFRIRPAEHMAAEMLRHARILGKRSFKFNDQLINGAPDTLERLCDLLIEKDEPMKWIALAQPRGDMDDALLRKMKAAGCFTLNLGLESGSDKILKLMGKGFTVAEMERALKQIFDAGINTMVNFIVGFPGETEEDFQATVDFLKRNRQWICGVTSVNTCIVLEGSPLDIGSKTFGIQFPDKNKDVGWWVAENTPAVRNDRASRLVAVIEQLGLPHLVSNLNEKNANLDELGLPDRLPEPEAIAVTEAEPPCPDSAHSSCLGPEAVFDQEKGKPYFEQINQFDTDLLLLMLPVWGVDVPPLGLAYLEAAVCDAGFSSQVLDLNIKLYNRATDHTLWRMESYKYWTDPKLVPKTIESFSDLLEHYIKQIITHFAPVIGLSVFTGNFPLSVYVAEKVKAGAPDKTIIFGGPGITNSFDIATLTRTQCDFMVLGDGESVLVELLKRITTGGDTTNIQGVIPVGRKIDFMDLPKALVMDLDSLPMPTFDGLSLQEYQSDSAPLLLSRGCIRRCAFCNDHHIGQKYRYRNPRKIFEEIEFHLKNRGVDRFTLLDVLINGRIDQLEQLCDLIIDSGYKIHWGGQGVIRKEMTPELLSKMAAAGCMSMVYGVESFSDRVLELMNKPYTRDLAKEILSRTHDAGIETIVNIIVGFPGETEQEFGETFDFLRDHQDIIDQVASISPCLVNLGSRLFEKYAEYGIIFPANEGSIKWYSEDGNNFEVRRKRVLELTSLLSRRDKSVHTVNLYDEKREEFEYIEHVSTKGDKKPVESPNEIKEEKDDSRPFDRPDALLALLPPWGVEFPPIALATLATYAESKGFDVLIEDLNIRWYDLCGRHLKAYWQPDRLKFWFPGEKLDTVTAFLEPEINAFVEKVAALSPLMVGFSTNESNLPITQIVAKRIKNASSETKVIFGGPGVTWPLDRKVVDPSSLDGFVVGEGEATFVDILSRLKKGTNLFGIAGYEAADENDTFVFRDLIRPLEEIPTPEFKGFPLQLYTKRELPLLFSRGCIGSCTFCNDHRITKNFRIKNPETLFAEVKKYKAELAGFEFAFNDLLVNASLKSLERFCDLVIEDGLRLAWTGQAVIDKKMDEPYMKTLAAAGCVSLVFGAESFSTPVLKAMGKRFEPDDAVMVFSAAKKAGIETIINLIVGFPGEGEKEFEQTLDFIRTHRDLIGRVSAVSTCIVVAQCALEKDPDKYGIVLPKPEHWCQWYTKDETNTYEIRAARLQKILALLDGLSICHNMTNLYLEKLEEPV